MVFILAVNSAITPYDVPSRVDSEETYAALASQELEKIVPLRLSQVCRLWRDITHRTSKLWTHINVSHLRPNYAPLLISHLTFSGNAPLDITLQWFPSIVPLLSAGDKIEDERDEDRDDTQGFKDIYYRAVKEHKPALREQMQMVVCFIERWRSFRLVLDDASVMQGFVEYFSTRAVPRLIAIDLRYIEPFEVSGLGVNTGLLNDGAALFAGVTNSPDIRSLHLDDIELGLPLPSLRSLTTLGLHNLGSDKMPRLAQLLDALDELPNLHRLYLHYLDSGEDMPPDIPDLDSNIVSLPALEELSLADVPQGWPEYFFRFTYFPNIKKLALDIYTDEFSFVLRVLNWPYSDKSDQSSDPMLCSLEGLRLGTFGGHPLQDRFIAEQEPVFFSELKNVRILLLDVGEDEGHISRVTKYTHQLTRVHDPTSTRCMPLLDTVFLRGVKDDRKQEIEDLVKARKKMGVPIRRLLIDRNDWYGRRTGPDGPILYGPSFTTEDVSWLKDNVAEVAVFDEVRVPSHDGIDETLNLLFEADGVVAAGEGLNLKFVDVFCDMLKL